jgi:hypothetical protein
MGRPFTDRQLRDAGRFWSLAVRRNKVVAAVRRSIVGVRAFTSYGAWIRATFEPEERGRYGASHQGGFDDGSG